MSGSNTVNMHVGSLEDMGKRFIDAWHRAERGEDVNETHVTFHDLPALLAALTPKRLDLLLRYVRHHEVRTVKALAADLHRDYKNVHKDVEELTKLDLLTRTADQVVAPYAGWCVLQIRSVKALAHYLHGRHPQPGPRHAW